MAPTRLARWNGMAAAPRGGLILYSGTATPVGRVANGFSLPLGGGAALYGLRGADGIAVLGAELGEGSDNAAVTRAFAALNARHGLIAVDWRSHIILTRVAADGTIAVWRPD